MDPHDAVEPLVVHIMWVLEAAKVGANMTPILTQIQSHLGELNVAQFAGSRRTSIEADTEAHVHGDVQRLLELYGVSLHQLDSSSMATLRSVVTSFGILSRALHLQSLPKKLRRNAKVSPKYSIDDVLIWVRLLRAPDVSSGCEALVDSVVPPFVTHNILLRTPSSVNEFYLQLDIWNTYADSIIDFYKNRPTYVRESLENLMYYCMAHDASKFPDLLCFQDTAFMTLSFINTCIWLLYLHGLQNPSPNFTLVVKAQEVLVKTLRSKDSALLLLRAHMGIVLAINYVLVKESVRLYQLAQGKFLSSPPGSVSPKDMAIFHISKVAMATSASQLVQAFNDAAMSYSHSTTLWFVLIRKLEDFQLLTAERSLKIIAELVGHKDTTLISKNIVLLLLRPIDSLKVLDQFVSHLRDAELFDHHHSALLPKYLSLLYEDNGTCDLNSWGLGSDLSSVEAARQLYRSIPHKSTHIIGIMLLGEAKHNPHAFYDIYKRELANTLPNGTCLSALLSASMYDNTTLVWDNLYAPQVSVHEFKKHVVSQIGSTDLDSAHVRPSSSLWQKYIRVLAKYEYVAEMAELIQWWESIGHRPSRDTLLLLVKSLPQAHGRRLLEHNEKVQRDGGLPVHNWPWPTFDDLNRLQGR